MSRSPRLISLAALAMALPSATLLSAQGGQTQGFSCDSRIDVCKLPPGGGALHEIRKSGSYVMSCNIALGAGETAISISSGASSVVVDGNGYSILGNPAHTSVSALVCPPAPAPRASLTLENMRAADLTGDAISVSNVDSLEMRFVNVTQCAQAATESADVGSIRMSGVSFSHNGTGISASSVSSLTVEGSLLLDNGTAASLSARSSRFSDVVIQGGTNGIVCDDSSLDPAYTGPVSLQCSDTLIEVVLAIAVGMTSPTGRPHTFVWDSCAALGCGQDGVSIAVAGPLEVSLSNSSSGGNHRDGFCLLSADAVRVTARDAFGNENGRNGLTVSAGTLQLQCWGSNFSDNTQRGLQVVSTGGLVGVGGDGGSLLLERSTFQGNGSDGCSVDFSSSSSGGKASFSDLHFTSNGGRGAALQNVSLTCESGECSSNAHEGMSVQGGESGRYHLWVWGDNGGSGLQIEDASAMLEQCSALKNAGDGVSVSDTVVGSSRTVYARFVDAAGNDSHGFFVGNEAPTLQNVSCSGNAGGGFLCSSSYPGSFVVMVTACDFTANGCIACDVQGAKGGMIERCVVNGGVTGISLGSLSCPACVSAVRVCNNTITACGTGLQVLAGGHHLVLGNSVSSSLAPYSVGSGNLFGPVVTSADMATNMNPSSNYMQP